MARDRISHFILAYRIKVSANYTGAGKSYLTHAYPSLGKDKNRVFSRVFIHLFYSEHRSRRENANEVSSTVENMIKEK